MDAFEHLDSLGQFNIKPGLSRIQRAMEELGSPHLTVPAVHVAGTNGKGATCHMTDAILSAFPLRRVLYTSPHLRSVTERILIDGEEVDRVVLGHHLDMIRLLSAKGVRGGLTYFESVTGACFSMLPEIGPDVLTAEVGLGGRWDATNILEPQACAITSISLDHTDLLGEDVASIASEKAGIVKPSTPLVLGPLFGCGEDRMRCLRSVLDVCSSNGSPVVLLCRSGEEGRMGELLRDEAVPDWRLISLVHRTSHNGTGFAPKVEREERPSNPEPRLRLLDNALSGDFTTPLLGEHQAFNAACAASLSLLVLPASLAHSRFRKGNEVPMEDLVEGCVDSVDRSYDGPALRDLLAKGLLRTHIKGRMETRPFGHGTVFLDGGHNVEAGHSIASTLRELYPGRRMTMLFSMMRDKDALNYLRNFDGMVHRTFITRLPLERGMGLDVLSEAASDGLGETSSIVPSEDIAGSISCFLNEVKACGLGLACGSFYLYDHVVERLNGKVP